MPSIELTVEKGFSAALAIPDHEGLCRQPHGYHFRIAVTIAQDVDALRAWSTDVLRIEQQLHDFVIAKLDRSDLRTVIEYPSLEGLAIWAAEQLTGEIVGLKKIEIKAPPDYIVAYNI